MLLRVSALRSYSQSVTTSVSYSIVRGESSFLETYICGESSSDNGQQVPADDCCYRELHIWYSGDSESSTVLHTVNVKSSTLVLVK